MSSRRAFLKFLAGSPLLAGMPIAIQAMAQGDIDKAVDALDVFDFELLAKKVLPPAHWGYMATGVDGEETLKANRDGFTRYQLRPRRFVDVSRLEMSVELFGVRYNSPIVLCPVGSQKAFHPDGEVGAARAAQAKGNLQILSTQTSYGVEEVIKARGGPIWYQLYTTDNFETTTKLVKRAEASGCTVTAVTVDLPAGRNTATMQRFQRADTRACGTCHSDATGNLANPRVGGGVSASKPMFAGINTQGLGLTSPSLTWEFIKRLKDVTKMKVVIKGLETREDAALAVEHGADGIIVSNHGGRATETGRGTIECVAEVVQGVRGRIPVIVDGGFRRGTDIYKALALGATAAGIGRPYIWGLSAFGQQGVERVIDILNNELRLAMVGCGARSLKEITAASLVDTGRRA
jgi:isopentenyl diphosphate isomerase/L-lactate dehydrogenase-like FMN-dependent dehydrogenase